ncbi:hypothetical protein CRP01_38250 [Flavilitoribacter nigricans DSM 23189 = NBRC 102662]|uniref:Uncharacterized protein n=1 Tax=Flavilitoribacter nigricans (strain ATCC 23147 / DSM 23189 / NBRC 102662 / NCIMB 1420 / SS-2) TaxID=1122177 RepID=A0A2D0MYH4_FLAN2|nr:hypothetical protein CRP01_38250 [Flavilitoribacter nigricans DSM 23189 = NBRC 102662]
MQRKRISGKNAVNAKLIPEFSHLHFIYKIADLLSFHRKRYAVSGLAGPGAGNHLPGGRFADPYDKSGSF